MQRLTGVSSCTSGSTSHVVTHAETISVYCSSVKSNSQSLTGWLMPDSPVTSLTCSLLRGETGVQTAACTGTPWTTAGPQTCQVITKLCIEHWHKHRCERTDLAFSVCLDTHSHAGRLTAFFSFHYNLCFGWRACRLLTLVVLTLMVGEMLSKLCWRGVKSNPICFGKHCQWAQKLNGPQCLKTQC